MFGGLMRARRRRSRRVRGGRGGRPRRRIGCLGWLLWLVAVLVLLLVLALLFGGWQKGTKAGLAQRAAPAAASVSVPAGAAAGAYQP
jgi:heme A synthase